ncbi:MAG: MltA domain-containing protein [Planctomycetes bacterium]|nr:MltA domain-containing protein [Planctomycetota bacterium]
MKHIQIILVLALSVFSACKSAPDYGRALPPGAPALLPLGPGDVKPDFSHQWAARDEIMPALDQSLAWAQKKTSAKHFPIEGITVERLQYSLQRFKAALTESKSAAEFNARLDREFVVLKSAGWDGKGGGVLYTAYCTPILNGHTEQSATYKYPLYALPDDLVKEANGEIRGRRTPGGSIEPYPTRRAIEAGGLLSNKKLELVWLKDPIDAYIAHVNGSAFVNLQDGSMLKLGYAGKNGREYTSLGAELVKDKKLKKDAVSLRAIRKWGKEHPNEVQEYLNRNDSFVFFTPIEGNPHGSLNVPVTANRSLATDKRLFPRGAIVYVQGHPGSGIAEGAKADHFMFDQDTGGAIRTAGRADIYMGSGDQAEAVSGSTRVEGQLYYLFVKDNFVQP